VVQRLLEKGTDVSAKTRDGQTELHEAALHGLAAVVQLLLGKGSADGRTPLHEAARGGRAATTGEKSQC
jgi:ankyrin repeat protein